MDQYKRIVICFDGTWNALSDPTAVTNVVRIGQAVRFSDDAGVKQVIYYNAGVGSGGPIDRLMGGVFGVGLRGNVQRGLAFLTLNWQEGDEIYIFGFSRGAYSARALAGVITAIGGVPRQEYFHELARIWDIYRLPYMQREQKKIQDELDEKVWRTPDATFLVKCLAVWDTVGSYGIPAGLGLGALARTWTSWTRGFRDNILHKRIEVGLQALAIDEARRAFPATTWLHDPSQPVDGQTIEQVWFAGAHSNVGGGYGESGLSDMALIWLMARVEFHTGLRFSESYIAKNFWPCAACSLYRSTRGWWLSRLFPKRRILFAKPVSVDVYRDRKRIKIDATPANEKVHWSVIERLGRESIVDEKVRGKYAPRNLPPKLNARPWREEERSSIEKSDLVATQTRREAELRDLCRQRRNKRYHSCALFCDYSREPGQRGSVFRSIGDFFSPKICRDRRMHRLREIWDMEDARGL
jgi:hypothetical protein